jgi:hypothetical protein
MKHFLRQVFRSPNFVIGFVIFMALLLIVIIYPLIITFSLSDHRSGYFLSTRDLCEYF